MMAPERVAFRLRWQSRKEWEVRTTTPGNWETYKKKGGTGTLCKPTCSKEKTNNLHVAVGI